MSHAQYTCTCVRAYKTRISIRYLMRAPAVSNAPARPREVLGVQTHLTDGFAEPAPDSACGFVSVGGGLLSGRGDAPKWPEAGSRKART